MEVSLANKIPIQALQNVEEVDPSTQALVTEFWYDCEGQVSYKQAEDVDVMLPKQNYAMLITANSFYMTLGTTLCNVTLMIASLMSQVSYCMALHSSMLYTDISSRLKDLYIGTFMVALLVWLSSATWATVKQMRASKMQGDFVVDGGKSTVVKLYMMALFFEMFNVPKNLSEIAIQLHPKKAVQPFSAIKKNGHRMWVLGWPSKQQCNYENQYGFLVSLPFTAALALPLVAIQLYINISLAGFDLGAALNIALKLASLLAKLRTLSQLLKDRSAFLEILTAATNKTISQAVDQAEMLNILVNWRLRYQYFGHEIPQEVEKKAAEVGFMVRTSTTKRL